MTTTIPLTASETTGLAPYLSQLEQATIQSLLEQNRYYGRSVRFARLRGAGEGSPFAHVPGDPMGILADDVATQFMIRHPGATESAAAAYAATWAAANEALRGINLYDTTKADVAVAQLNAMAAVNS